MKHNEWKVIYGINLPVLIQERRGGGEGVEEKG